MREIRVSANTEGRSLGEAIADIKQRAAGLALPAGYSIDYTGETEDMVESFGYVMQPLAIMFSLPLSLVVPVVYTYLDDLGALFVRWWSRKTPAHAGQTTTASR